ncbi:Crp/Fnr family transcriptional regulator [Riemerella anatipestifer]|uniref:Crp/Fnr family transcriptional regulator n=1 Tax=Riemerella anatipestifer TaxID=34085 RepID=UPI0030BD1431
MKFELYLKQFVPDSEALEQKISNFIRKRTLQKGTILQEPFTFSKNITFFEEGLARIFYYRDGKDITHHFFKQNEFTAPIESIFFGKPSPYGLELLEKSTISVLSYEKMEELKSEFPQIEKLQNLVLVNTLHSFSERLYAIQFQTAKDRYKTLMMQHPDILLRAPLGHIASYLGITQQTLSVIRTQI